MPSTSPADRVVWITGASQGIGAALALRAARAGATVAISARDENRLAAIAEAVPERLHIFPLDVTQPETTAMVADRIEATLGPIDIAVLNAGTHKETPVEAFRAVDVEALCRLNLVGQAIGLEVLMGRMISRRRGRIALVSSVAGYRGLPRAAAYCATKAGVIAMAEALRSELHGTGVTMQVVCPGFVRTPLTDRNDFPMPFLMEPEDAADRIWRGLQSDRFEIAFPRRFVWLLKFLRLLPASLYFSIIRKVSGVGYG